MPNPRGSTGYGQKFIDEINNDWGGRAFDDIMAVADHIVSDVPFADGSKMGAAGGSYGGYMIDWILGHTQRFKALVTHDGVYDLVSEFGATEELWFPIWEYGGTPWDKPENYAKWSPNNYVHGVPHADPGDPRRTGLPRAIQSGNRVVHRTAASEGAVETVDLPR